ncbi:PHP domain-containing protein [Naasia sp. SYSU D00948]|uniref:PHP domain-containing protein n=1 Tax=Naasia sp. SYSU D00948 TaxID=2817379 RepID=UPI001FED639F|nr:PHP domain-containing protein [Naasia sp. SYSU D00948]
MPADSHVHSEWSWDALMGSMTATCAKAAALGLPAIAFTEHVDFTPFRAGELKDTYPQFVGDDGILRAPEFDAEGYLDAVAEPYALYSEQAPEQVLGDYLAEIPRMMAGSSRFDVCTHIDYPLRTWPRHARPFDPGGHEDEFRLALRAVADGGRAVEVSARIPLDPLILRWWIAEGGARG